jgi:hypothetical protein
MTQMPLYDGPFGQRYSPLDFIDASRTFSSSITALPGLPKYNPRTLPEYVFTPKPNPATEIILKIAEEQASLAAFVKELKEKEKASAKRKELISQDEMLQIYIKKILHKEEEE